MSYKIGLIADAHLNIFRRNNTFFSHVEQAFDYFNEICDEQDVSQIIILGDLFHTKHYISTEALIKASNVMRKLAKHRPIFCIVGNHDLVKQDNNEINVLDVYRDYKNVHIISNYERRELQFDKMFHFVPFHAFDIPKTVSNIKLEKGTNYLFGHFGVKNFALLNTTQDREITDYVSEITVADLNKFNHVFLGHFHGYQNQDNVTYVSSPFQSCHGDEFSKHGFVIFDIHTGEHEFYENKYSPQFITRDFTKDNIKELLNVKDHYIRFMIHKHVSKDLLVAVKTKLLANNYDVEWKFNIADTNISVPQMDGWDAKITYSNPDELIQEFINQIKLPQGFDKDKLLEILFR